MPYLDTLVAERRALWRDIKRMLDRAEQEHRNLTAPEESRYARATDELALLDERIEQVRSQQTRTEEAVAALAGITGRSPDMPVPTTFTFPSGGDIRTWATEQRAVDTSGITMPSPVSSQFWDRLRAESVVLSSGVRVLPVGEGGKLTVPGILTSATVAGVAESALIGDTAPVFADVELEPRKFAATVTASSEVLADSAGDLRAILGSDLTKQMAETLDKQMLDGDGTGQNLTGFLRAGTAGPSITTAPTADDLLDIVTAYEGNDGPAGTGRWFMHPTVWAAVRALTATGSGEYLLGSLGAGPGRSLVGYPVSVSTNVPATKLALVDTEQVVVGQSMGAVVDVSTDVRFSYDEVVLRIRARVDIGVRDATGVIVSAIS